MKSSIAIESLQREDDAEVDDAGGPQGIIRITMLKVLF